MTPRHPSETWHVIDVHGLRTWIGDHWSDLGRLRVATDGALEYCDRVIVMWTETRPDPPVKDPR